MFFVSVSVFARGVTLLFNSYVCDTLPSSSHQEYAEVIAAVNFKEVTLISPEQFEAIRSLWQDPVIVKAYERRREFHLSDSAK